ncbi:MAG: enoyl-CoA hydratase-related protein [Haloarculaceae archaeon]
MADSDDPNGDEAVLTDREGHVGLVTLNRPGAMNTFSTGLATALDDALREFEAADGVRAVVVHGAGEAFSAGIDLSEHREFEGEAEYEQWVTRMEQPFLTLAEMGTPVVAAAHGHAAANGIGLVAACDLAVAAEGTQLGATAPKVGLFCMGPAVPLMGAVTRKRCLELLLTGDLITAETAQEWGLLNRVTDPGEHVASAVDLAETIAAKSPTAIQRGKRAFYEMAGMSYGEALSHSNREFATLCTTADAEAGIEAFLEGDPLGPEEWPGDD